MMLGRRLRQRPPPSQTSSSSLLPLPHRNHPKEEEAADDDDDTATALHRSTVAQLPAAFIAVGCFSFSLFAWIIIYFANSSSTTPTNNPENAIATTANPSSSRIGRGDYIMWSNEEAYFAECRRSMIGNQTWGDPLAPLVDKIEAKYYAQRWSPSVQIVPTIDAFDIHNISDFTFDYFAASQLQPFIIKPSHMTGLVLRVVNDTLTCVKGSCKRNRITEGNIHHDPAVFSSMMDVLRGYLTYDFSTKNGQTQYHLIPPRIVLEQYLPMDAMRDVTYWYIAGGKPIFVSMECDDPTSTNNNNHQHHDGSRIYLTASYQRLTAKLTSKACVTLPPKPKSWERMRRVAEETGPYIPPGAVVRLDLYAGDDTTDVYFSEFTFTTAVCRPDFRPRAADGLLYAVAHGAIPSSSVTPDLVRDVIMDTSWVPVFVRGDIALDRSVANAASSSTSSSSSPHPSPVDLCLNMPEKENYEECIDAAKTVARSELRCVVHEEHETDEDDSANNATASDVRYRAVGAPRSPSFASVWSRVPRDKIGILLILFLLARSTTKLGGTTATPNLLRAAAMMSNTKSKEEKPTDDSIGRRHHNGHTTTTLKYSRFRNNIILYHLGLAIYMYYTSENDGMFSSHSLTFLIDESFQAFRTVHPISSPMIILCHFATYWLNVAAWFAPSLPSLFLRQLLAELIPPLANEYAHHTEALENVRCMRIVFIDSVQRHVMDEIIRGYFLPQFFVYFYLLPKFVMHRVGLLAVTGDSFVAVFACHLAALTMILLSGVWFVSSRHRREKNRRLQLPS